MNKATDKMMQACGGAGYKRDLGKEVKKMLTGEYPFLIVDRGQIVSIHNVFMHIRRPQEFSAQKFKAN